VDSEWPPLSGCMKTRSPPSPSQLLYKGFIDAHNPNSKLPPSRMLAASPTAFRPQITRPSGLWSMMASIDVPQTSASSRAH